MGLFGKKKSSDINKLNTVKKTSTVNADDIWNSVLPKKETVTIKESKYSKPATEEIKGVEAIEPDVIRDKMAQLEKELEAKKNKPVKTYVDYDVNPVHDDEIRDAQEEYEKLYKVEHEKFVQSHKEEISVMQEDNVEDKVRVMIENEDERIHENDGVDFGFSNVGRDEVEDKLSKLPYAKKPEDYPEYKDIKSADSVSDEDINSLGRIDHSGDDDAIRSVDDDVLAEKVREFNEKYSR